MPSDKNTIQSYNQYAVKWAERMRSGKNLFHFFLEKPAMYKMLPGLKGKAVLCLGCGSGEECQHLKSLGAGKVIGIDAAQKLIAVAKKSYPDIEFQTMSMENLKFFDRTFDLIYSSLALHYLRTWKRVLKKDGVFLFSTHSPFMWGRENYFQERKINDVWFDGEFKVSYYHRPLASMMRDILNSGFVILDFQEPIPIRSSQKIDSDFFKTYSSVPNFIIFKLKKEE